MNLTKILLTTSIALTLTSTSLFAIGENGIKDDEIAYVRSLQMSVSNEVPSSSTSSSSTSSSSTSDTLPDTEVEIRAHFKAQQGNKFKHILKANDCLTPSQRTEAIFENVWEHEDHRREVQLEALKQCYIFGIGPDLEALTENRPFSLPRNLGHEPAIVAALSGLLEANRPQKLLEVGPAFGINALVLLEKYPTLHITTLDLYHDHVNALNGMAKHKGLQDRLTASQGRFPDPLLNDEQNDTFDVVVFSKVLSFYKETDIQDMLRVAAQKLKPGGSILLTTSSDHTSNAVWLQQRLANSSGSLGLYWGGPYGVWPLNYGYCNFLKDTQITTMATELGLETNSCEYVGISNVNWAQANSGRLVSVDQKRAHLFAHLKKPASK